MTITVFAFYLFACTAVAAGLWILPSLKKGLRNICPLDCCSA